MRKFKLFFGILFLGAWIFFGYYVFDMMNNRYNGAIDVKDDDLIITKNTQSTKNWASNNEYNHEVIEEMVSYNEKHPIANNDNNDSNDSVDDDVKIAEIDDLYCINECKNFLNETKELKHCKQVCGFIPMDTETKLIDCEVLENNEKDYCLRDSAVNSKSFELCKKIKNQKIKGQCINRVKEEIIDNL